MTAQQRKLTTQDYKTLSLSALGGALEFYDFIVYAFFAGMISTLFFPPDIPEWLKQLQTFGIFAAGYLSRPFGGIIMAHFGDRFGRKRMFALSILLMAIPTFAIGLLPTYQTVGAVAPLLLLLMRIMQGIAIGGEIPGAWVFVSEHVPSHRVGLACGILTTGLTLGILIGSLVHMLLTYTLTEQQLLDYAWRIPFLLGGIFGFVTMYLRRWLKETPIFIEMQRRKTLAKEIPVKAVLVGHYSGIIVSMLLTWTLSAGILVIMIMAPNYLVETLGINSVQASLANCSAIISLAISCTVYGWLVDKYGASRLFIYGSLVGSSAVFFFYYCANYHSNLLLVSYSLAGFCIGLVGCFGYTMVKVFPSHVRFSGVSFSFNMAYAISAAFTTPLVITLTQFYSRLSPAFYVMALLLMVGALGFYLRNDSRVNDSTPLDAIDSETIDNLDNS